MLKRISWIAVALSALLFWLVLGVAAFLSVYSPVEVTGDSNPPEMGRVYSKEEMDQRERAAKEAMAKAWAEFDTSRSSDAVRSRFLTILPISIFSALAVIFVLGWRARISSVLIISLPLVALLLIVRVHFAFAVLGMLSLLLYAKFRRGRPAGQAK